MLQQQRFISVQLFNLYFQSVPGNKLVVLLVTIFYASYAFGVVFVICELCQRLTNAFDKITDVFAQLKWYLLSNNFQQMMLLTLLINVQQPVDITCFGSISCCRQTFVDVSIPRRCDTFRWHVKYVLMKMNPLNSSRLCITDVRIS